MSWRHGRSAGGRRRLPTTLDGADSRGESPDLGCRGFDTLVQSDRHDLSAQVLDLLGTLIAGQPSRLARTERRLQPSLKIVGEYNDRWAMAYLLEDMGCLASLQGQPERALRLAGAADALRQAIGAPRSATEQQKLDDRLANARQTLEEPAATGCIADGKSMNLVEAAAYAAGST